MMELTSYRKGLLMVGLLAGVSAGVLVFSTSTTRAAAPDKFLICHFDGQDGTDKSQTLELPFVAANLHVNTETGTPAAGHERDSLGACESPSPSPSSTPSGV
jgi:hypothetical protein